MYPWPAVARIAPLVALSRQRNWSSFPLYNSNFIFSSGLASADRPVRATANATQHKMRNMVRLPEVRGGAGDGAKVAESKLRLFLCCGGL